MPGSRKVCVITGTRAEYGLLKCLMREIDSTENLQLQIVATGTHLSPEFGLTYRQIESDGFVIDRKLEMILSSDTSVGVSKSMGLGVIGFSDIYSDLEPDLVVVLGDRFEIFSAVSSALIAQLPVVHLHGGELSEGAFDDALRHSISKMSHLHFTATETYRNRVIQLGEHPDRVFNVGALGVESIKGLNLLSRKDLEEEIGFKLGRRNLIITFHPVTLEKSGSDVQFSNLLKVLGQMEGTHLIFTKSNADVGGRSINHMIDEFVEAYRDQAVAYTSMGQLRYLSCLQFVDGVIGNSSSGLIEAPSFRIGTVNIGDRQSGRIKAKSVIDCGTTEQEIHGAISRLYSNEFQAMVRRVQNPYDQEDTSKKIVEVIRTYPLENILKKKFYDCYK